MDNSNIEKEILRKKALERLNTTDFVEEIYNKDNIKEMFHELKVHQIELELQNDELRNTQVSLEESKQNYFNLFNNAPNGYVILDSKATIINANLEMQNIFDCNIVDIKNKSFNSFLSEKDSNKFLSIYNSFYKKPENKIYDFKTNAKHIQVYGRHQQIFLKNQNYQVLFLNVIDITEIEKANSKVIASELKYHEIFNNANDAIFLSNPQSFEIIEWNDKASELFNFYNNESVNYNLQNLFKGELKDKILRKYIDIATFKSFSNQRCQVKNISGSIIPIEISATLLKIDQQEVILSIARDLTERESMLKQIEKDAEFYSSVIHSSLEGFWIFDNDKVIHDINNAACQMLGYKKDEMIGMHLEDIITNNDEFNKNIQNILLKKKNYEKFDVQLRRSDKHIIYVEISLSILATRDSNIYVAYIKDTSSEIINKKILKKRLELVEYSVSHTIDEVIQKALDFAEEITGSEIAFWHHLADDGETILLQQWSTKTLQINCTTDGKGHHSNINEAGVWAECIKTRKPVIHNDYQNLQNKNKLPEGHAFIIRELIIPIFKENKIVALIGVGNKKSDYVEEDIIALELFGGVAWTIYEKQFANETLVKSEQKNKAIVAVLPDLLFEFSKNGVFLNYHCSDYSKLFMQPDKFLGKNIINVLPQNIAELIQFRIDETLIKDDMVSFEYSSFVDSKYQYFAVRMVKFSAHSVLCFMRDITEKQVAKELIIESEEKFSKVFFNSPLIKTIVDIKTDKFIDVNNSFEKITGFTKEDALGKTAVHIGLLKSEERKRIYKELDKKGNLRNFQVTFFKKNGIPFICNYSLEVVSIAGKDHLLTLAEDISEKIKVEEELENYRNNLEKLVNQRTLELNELNKKLDHEISKTQQTEKIINDALDREKELSKMKSQFIHLASNEFRTPLTTIKNASEIIETYLEKDDKNNALLQTKEIQNSINNVVRLLDEILSINNFKK